MAEKDTGLSRWSTVIAAAVVGFFGVVSALIAAPPLLEGYAKMQLDAQEAAAGFESDRLPTLAGQPTSHIRKAGRP